MIWPSTFFKPSEFDSPDEKGSGARMNLRFISKLDDARKLCDFPWKVSKGGGLRTPAYNVSIKGAKVSFHLSGEAADIACRDGMKRYQIVAAAIAAGIKGIEVCDGHVHLDNRASPYLWPDKSR